MKEKEVKKKRCIVVFIDGWCLWSYDLVLKWTSVVALRCEIMVVAGR